jgi:preprotein translocase subunit SecG
MQMPGWMKWAIALAIGLGIIAIGWKLSSHPWLFFILPTFFVINCLVLIIVVLLQSGKAADLAGAFGGAGSQTAFGPRGAANALSSATTWCAIMFMICALALVLRVDKTGATGSSILQQVSKPAPAKPATPTPTAPASQTPTAPASQTPAPASNPPASQPPAEQPPKK